MIMATSRLNLYPALLEQLFVAPGKCAPYQML